MPGESFVDYDTVPSAIISDGLVTAPLWAVSQISLGESYHLPAIGTSSLRASIGTHDDTVTLSALLIGPERYTFKLTLETLAESGKRGSVLERISGGSVGGLVLITGMTVRTDMQIQSITFSASATRRDVLDVSMTLMHAPRPSALTKLLEVANVGVRSLVDFGVL